uniref:Uncharacterized protein n=1 Tax=Palpitomonas bilix TaxID=652834 RepID=A0A7S3GM85_9EUKA|mmetsp:Transcript_9255/g.25180  ORF Transcript_9255/g.25180 Transcript_9255/m.25180 type:complete len:334 (+) Transcript_9255:277-1278(+)|eukprot:CAMPEP_0113886628 /NCGR_PEP_ID=MMETSP0780_2-20120614/11675_1 /TAXON_ID=652834 /ORGANISM="Palpitomonas bilix" /LENGTH=333 /DNA_ID=CAMNT_0000874893 /DNA_START=276 /DNA_END=1277 /DNA_ORIENTATION=+ /assembly_acc=CAM_ASM_000599
MDVVSDVVNLIKPVKVLVPPLSDSKLGIDHQEEGEGLEATKDFKAAFRCFIYSATYGHPRGLASRNRLALCLSAEEVQQVGKELIEEVSDKARGGDPASLHVLGILFDKGWGVGQSFGRAFNCYLKAVEKGFLMSIYNVAVFLANGLSVDKDVDESMRLYNIAAEAGVASAMNNIGTYYVAGQGVPVDHQKANDWFFKAANNDDSVAQSNLGYRMFFGVGCKPDRDEGIRLLKKSVEAEYEDAYYKLALCYSDTRGAGPLFSPIEAAYYANYAMKFENVEKRALSLLQALRGQLPSGWEKAIQNRVAADARVKERRRQDRAVRKYIQDIALLF